MLGLSVMMIFIILALIAPVIAPYDPAGLVSEKALESPSNKHFFGTDALGRDVLSRTLYGARTSISIGIVAALIATILGTAIGAVAGYYGGVIGHSLVTVVEFGQILPPLLVAMMLFALFTPSMWNTVIIAVIFAVPMVARLVRAEFLSLKERPFVHAAVIDGERKSRIILGEILPNSMSAVISGLTISVAFAILLETMVSFLGLGDPNTISWGQMLKDAQQYMRHAWWMPLFPGLAIFILVFAVNQAGDGLVNALEPRVKALREG